MVRTKLLLPLWLYHHRALYGLLEETADCWKRQHKKKDSSSQTSVTQLGCFLPWCRFNYRKTLERIDTSCRNHTTEFLANQRSPLTVCRESRRLFQITTALKRNVTASKHLNRGEWGDLHARAFCSLIYKCNLRSTLQNIQSKIIFNLIGHSFQPTKHVKWESKVLETPIANS